MIYAISIVSIGVIFFIVWLIKRSRKDGANEQIAEEAVQHSEETREINEMENKVDEEFQKKRPSGTSAIRDFFKRGG